jgi:glycosyltransferase involved in cell wall biosynthesis
VRIAHIITRLIRGGADENTLLSCNGQAELGHDVHLIYGLEASDDMVRRLHPAVIPHQIRALRRPLTPVSDTWAALATASLLLRIRPEIVHTHTSKAGAIGRVAARIAKTPGVVHGIHILPFLNVGLAEQLAYLTTERLLAPVTDAFVDVSYGMMETALANGMGPAPKHTVVPSGMDLTQFRDALPIENEQIAAVFGCPVDAASRMKLLVMTAALEPRKRVIEFLDVFARVVESEPAAALAVLGEGRDRDAILARVHALGLAGKVTLPGFRSDVERWISRADICVLASEREGLPRAVVQYVLAGRPVVSTALPGLEDIVKSGVSGFLVPTHFLHEMAPPICALLANPQLAESMSREAKSLDLSRWSTRHMVDSLEDVYRSVLKQGRTH